jgi:hypothetical protein
MYVEWKGICLQVPPMTSMTNITAHVLPSGEGKKMKAYYLQMIHHQFSGGLNK